MHLIVQIRTTFHFKGFLLHALQRKILLLRARNPSALPSSLGGQRKRSAVIFKLFLRVQRGTRVTPNPAHRKEAQGQKLKGVPF